MRPIRSPIARSAATSWRRVRAPSTCALTRDGGFDTTGAPCVQPGAATQWIGNGAAKFYRADLAGPTAWGTGFDPFDGTGDGDAVYLNASSAGHIYGTGLIAVPSNYVSGALLNSSARYASQTFASLGLVAGTYAYSFASRTAGDSFTVVVAPTVLPQPPVAAVPEPAGWALMILGLGLVGAVLRRRGRDPVRIAYAA